MIIPGSQPKVKNTDTDGPTPIAKVSPNTGPTPIAQVSSNTGPTQIANVSSNTVAQTAATGPTPIAMVSSIDPGTYELAQALPYAAPSTPAPAAGTDTDDGPTTRAKIQSTEQGTNQSQVSKGEEGTADQYLELHTKISGRAFS